MTYTFLMFGILHDKINLIGLSNLKNIELDFLYHYSKLLHQILNQKTYVYCHLNLGAF